MSKRKGLIPLLPFLALAVLLLSGITLAQSDGGYDLSWSTMDGGGCTFSEGGGYSLGGTIGQPDAGAMSDGGYTLSGGFWGGIVSIIEELYHIYLPLILKNYGP